MIPIHVDGEISLAELERVFGEAGYVLRYDAASRLCAYRVPPFLRKDAPATNVVAIKRKGIRRA